VIGVCCPGFVIYRMLSNPRVPKIMLKGSLCSTSERPIAVHVSSHRSNRGHQCRYEMAFGHLLVNMVLDTWPWLRGFVASWLRGRKTGTLLSSLAVCLRLRRCWLGAAARVSARVCEGDTPQLWVRVRVVGGLHGSFQVWRV
jgi:hypothetical protein